MAQKQARRKRDEEEPEQFDEQSEDFDDEESDDLEQDGNQVGLRLKDDMVEIDLPRDGSEGKTLHAIADMLDQMAA